MNTRQRKYDAERDFLRVRDFLVDSFSLLNKPVNWKLERWNYARYYVLPMLVTPGVGDPDLQAVDQAVKLWNEITGIWENKTGDIVGVVNIEHPDPTHPGWGEAFLQHHPDYDSLLPNMLTYAEKYLLNKEKNQVFIPIYDYDEALIAAAQARGYEKSEKYTIWDSVFSIQGQRPKPLVPDGYQLHSMADEGSDIDKRRKAFGLAFNHPDPKDWPSRLSYEGLQQAPDYRSELDIYSTAPDGEYVAFCIAWWDAANRIASLEPVGTVPGHRRKGLAQAAVFEAMNRAADFGAQRIFVGSDQEFYLAIGFELAYPAHHWVKTL
jgi:predicted N-acetyltransferase YhbS